MPWKRVDSGFIQTAINISLKQLFPFYASQCFVYSLFFLATRAVILNASWFFSVEIEAIVTFSIDQISKSHLREMNDFNSFGRVNKIKHVRYVLNVSHSHKKEHFCTVRACVAQTMLRENEKEREWNDRSNGEKLWAIVMNIEKECVSRRYLDWFYQIFQYNA